MRSVDPRGLPIMARQLAVGLATHVPALNALRTRRGTGGSIDARYCYGVWLRHLVLVRRVRPDLRLGAVAELGPGDSLGLGLCALLSGARRYVGLDVVPFAHAARNRAVLDQLVELFRRRAPIPGHDEFPQLRPRLDDGDLGFPDHAVPDLDRHLEPARIQRIAADLDRVGDPTSMIGYVAPWTRPDHVGEGSIDFAFSQAVLEHVDDLAGTYRALHRWLAPDGIMSHQIDFRCHGTAPEWNGHWTYPDWLWQVMRGKRPYLLNRQPHSVHVRLLEEAGFQVLADVPVRSPSALGAADLAPPFRHLDALDRTTSGAFVVAARGTLAAGLEKPPSP